MVTVDKYVLSVLFGENDKDELDKIYAEHLKVLAQITEKTTEKAQQQKDLTQADLNKKIVENIKIYNTSFVNSRRDLLSDEQKKELDEYFEATKQMYLSQIEYLDTLSEFLQENLVVKDNNSSNPPIKLTDR